MPQTVGSILVALQAKSDDLEKKLGAAERRLARYRKEAIGANDAFGESARKSGGVFERAMEKVGLKGKTVEKAFKNATAGALLSVGALGQVNEKAELASNTLGAFLAGGPIAGGIVALTGLFKLFAKDGAEEAAKQAEEARKKYDEWLESTKKGAEDARKAVEDLVAATSAKQFKRVGIDISEKEIGLNAQGRTLLDQIAAQRQKYEAALVKAGGTSREAIISKAFREEGIRGDTSGVANKRMKDLADEKAALDALLSTEADVRRQLAEINKQKAIDAESDYTKNTEEAAAAALKEAEAINSSLAALRAKTDLERDVAEAMAERAEAMKKVAALGRDTPEGQALAGAANDRFASRLDAAKRAEAQRYASDIEKQRADERKWWEEQFKAMDKKAEEDAKAAERSSEFVTALEHQADAAEAVSEDAAMRAELEGNVAEAIERGTLALWDADRAYAAIERILSGKAAERARKEEEKRKEKAADLRSEYDDLVATSQADLAYHQKLLLFLDDENGALKAQHDRELALLEVHKKIEALREKAKKSGGITEAEINALAAIETANVEAIYQKALKDGASKAAKSPTATMEFLDALRPTLETGLADLIYDGITTGFKNAQDIALRIVDSLLQQVLQSIVSSGIQAAFGGLFSGGSGGGGLGGVLAGVFSAASGIGGSSGVGSISDGALSAGAIASGAAGIGGCDT